MGMVVCGWGRLLVCVRRRMGGRGLGISGELGIKGRGLKFHKSLTTRGERRA